MMETNILLIDEIQGDTLTPIGIYQRLSAKRNSCLKAL